MNIVNTKNILASIDPKIKMVVVTKNQSLEDIKAIYELGHRDFGENKLQEIINKKEVFPGVNWHFIGRIQTNKIKDIVKNCTMIHSVSSYKILDHINIQAEKQDKIQDCLIQFNVAQEESKAGFMIDEADDIIKYCENLSHVNICGIMLMGPHTDDDLLIAQTFKDGAILADKLSNIDHNIKEISMGMSSDYQIAIKQGSTILRIGSLLFE